VEVPIIISIPDDFIDNFPDFLSISPMYFPILCQN